MKKKNEREEGGRKERQKGKERGGRARVEGGRKDEFTSDDTVHGQVEHAAWVFVLIRGSAL